MSSDPNGVDLSSGSDPTEDAAEAASSARPGAGDAIAPGRDSAAGASADHREGATDGDPPAGSPPEDRVADLERRIAGLEAELDAVRGLLDGVEAVDEAVERRASTALAKAEALEARVGTGESGLVRERLPDEADPDAHGTDGSAPERRRAGADTGSSRARSDARSGGLRDGDVGGPEAGSLDADDRAFEAGRGPDRPERGDPDAGTAGNEGTGTISSVGDAGGGAAAGTHGHDRAPDADAGSSLAARLRDAFR